MDSGFDGEVVRGLRRLAELLALDGGEAERVRSLLRAAEVVRGAPRQLREVVEEEGLEGVHRLGLGYELSGLITDFVRSGRLPWLERLEEREGGRQSLQRLPGIGPRLEQEVTRVLGVRNVEQLAESVQDGRLARVCGFGPRRLELLRGAIAAMGVPRKRRGPVQLSFLYR